MHDPEVVAWTIPSLVPQRTRWRDAKAGDRRWVFERRRRTNPENLGEPVYRWWRPAGWKLRLAGRAYGLREAATIWHIEPRGADALTVCRSWVPGPDGRTRPTTGWKWHVHHWRVTVRYEQRLRRFLWERCQRCGRRFPWGYAPVSHSWDAPKSRWFRVERRAFHHECSVLGTRERQLADQEAVVRELVSAYRVGLDLSEKEAVERLCGASSPWPFHVRYQLEGLLGWERDDNHALRRKESTHA